MNASVKYEVIYRHREKYSISEMCRFFGVSRSGYYGITPSISRRGNPYDNALAENFFSILKTECIHRTKIASFSEANALIHDYIYFYSHQRVQIKTKLTPLELRRQYVA